MQAIHKGMNGNDKHFLIGVEIHRPKVVEILGVKLSSIVFSQEWADPQLIFGYMNGNLVIRLETYENNGHQVRASIPATPEDAINIFRGLSHEFRIIDVNGKRVRV